MTIASPSQLLEHAPGAPGISPTWSSSAKDMVGSTLGPARLWFTLGCGIVNEVYYPRVDLPQIRDLGFIVAGSDGFWSEVKRNANYQIRRLAPGCRRLKSSTNTRATHCTSGSLRTLAATCWRSNAGSRAKAI